MTYRGSSGEFCFADNYFRKDVDLGACSARRTRYF